MATKTFPNPKRPYSLKGIVKKIVADPDYAKFIYSEVRKARGDDRAAAARLAAARRWVLVVLLVVVAIEVLSLLRSFLFGSLLDVIPAPPQGKPPPPAGYVTVVTSC